MTSNKTTISDAEKALFRDAVKGARRLRHDRVQLDRENPRIVKRPQQKEESSQLDDELLVDPTFPEDLPDQEHLAYQTTGIQRNTLRKLRRGQLPFFAELDLHGCTVEQARQLLQQALMTPRPGGHCLHIIHGRGLGSPDGRGILKTRVAYWLSQHPDVLAYFSAQPMHGGTGALYVLLRSKS